MSNAEINEIIKAMAYGFTDGQVAEECEMTVEEVAEFRAKYYDEIIERRSEVNGQ